MINFVDINPHHNVIYINDMYLVYVLILGILNVL
jgi:hypothetical protein